MVHSVEPPSCRTYDALIQCKTQRLKSTRGHMPEAVGDGHKAGRAEDNAQQKPSGANAAPALSKDCDRAGTVGGTLRRRKLATARVVAVAPSEAGHLSLSRGSKGAGQCAAACTAADVFLQ